MNDSAEAQRDVYRSQLEAIIRGVSRKDSFSMDADLVHDLGLDSVAMMSFIIEVEEAFGVIIGGKEIEDNVLKTPSSLLNFILSK